MMNWRTAAAINTGIIILLSICINCFLIVALFQAGGFAKPLVFYRGTCGQETSRLNLGLHFVLNLFSTIVLTSSNFFMQVLNAPSREELDKAHARGVWLAVGVSSIRNVFRVTWIKSLLWLGFLVTSLPIHLLFNSTIFEIDNRNSTYDLAIVAEAFTQRGAYYLPGASLLGSGGDPISHSYRPQTFGYGQPVGNTDLNQTSGLNKVSRMAEALGSWDRISSQSCMEEYWACSGLTRHRNMVVIIDSPGWTLSAVWSLGSNASAFWDTLLPKDAPNSLWLYTSCEMSFLGHDSQILCSNDCYRALGGSHVDSELPWIIPFYDELPWISHGNASHLIVSEYRILQNNLTVLYCLAEPVDTSCMLGLSTTLLSAVALSVVLKACLCILSLVNLNLKQSLVTLGDAIESFVCNPSIETRGLCIVNQDQMRTRAILPGPRQWRSDSRKQGAVVPRSGWVSTYMLFAYSVVIPAAIHFFGRQQKGVIGTFSPSLSNLIVKQELPLIRAVILANTPHLALSLCYLAYNNLFTCLQAGKEWAEMSTGFRGLRVTTPKGSQTSTYRLQLPYRYSVPLIILSIFLHWLLSNTIYVFITAGDYYGASLGLSRDPGLPLGAGVAVGLSEWSLVSLLTILVLLRLIPLPMALRKLPGNSVIVGSNSRALAAACHVSPLAKPDTDTECSTSVRDDLAAQQSTVASLRGKAPSTDIRADNEHDGSRLGKLSQSKLRWGVVEMPPRYWASFEQPVGHVSFGTEQDNIIELLDRAWYA